MKHPAHLRALLFEVAALAAASLGASHCSSSSPGSGTTVQVSADVACGIVSGPGFSPDGGGACGEACGPDSTCTLSDSDRSLACSYPADAGPKVTVACTGCCTMGRMTAGIGHPEPGQGDGAALARRAYFEAASVFAFERLQRELSAHGAPAPLLREARRARRDEVRHTTMQGRLARRHGADVRLPEAPPTAPARPLFEVALENAVEGCVRETYGAVEALVEARSARDPAVRRAMRSIAPDECRHAELAWAVFAWARPRLTRDQQGRIEEAMRVAVAEIHGVGPRIAEILHARLWNGANID